MNLNQNLKYTTQKQHQAVTDDTSGLTASKLHNIARLTSAYPASELPEFQSTFIQTNFTQVDILDNNKEMPLRSDCRIHWISGTVRHPAVQFQPERKSILGSLHVTFVRVAAQH
ncbi:hypothetical protein CAPTEDRAFT_189569 [Capitella teleta]|uniref:Uncharacterized protein n=1 Tax=Capitella teleta TaxID=283909 RepID=R7UQN5_CAPTE|nr:hypothetical protein CAPTEDRAFT_189569 [Capitella teleta]|eukprot:ELU05721.1 hypothetical protein CAPTEDRAFT_189569 [Capitella teleta]